MVLKCQACSSPCKADVTSSFYLSTFHSRMLSLIFYSPSCLAFSISLASRAFAGFWQYCEWLAALAYLLLSPQGVQTLSFHPPRLLLPSCHPIFPCVMQLLFLSPFACSYWYHLTQKWLILPVTSHQNIRSLGAGTLGYPLLQPQSSSVTFMSTQWMTKIGKATRLWRAGWEPWWSACEHSVLLPDGVAWRLGPGLSLPYSLFFSLSVEEEYDDGGYVWTWPLYRYHTDLVVTDDFISSGFTSKPTKRGGLI